MEIAFINKYENGFYWLTKINSALDGYEEIDGDRRLYVVKDMAKRWGYKLVSPNQFNNHYKNIKYKMYDDMKKYAKGGRVNETTELLNLLEQHYLYDQRSLGLITDKKRLEDNRIDWENDISFTGKLYQYLKKYEIIGDYKILYIKDEEKIKDFQNRVKELKSNGYAVIQKVSKPDKNKNKSYRFIAIKEKEKYAKGGNVNFTYEIGGI